MFKELFENSKYKKGQTIKFKGDKTPYTLKSFIKFGKSDGDDSEYWKCTDSGTINIPVSDDEKISQIEYIK